MKTGRRRGTGHLSLEKYPPLHPALGGARPGNTGGGGAVEKGGRMSATQTENKQTSLRAQWQEARFPASTWQSLRQGL